MRRLPLDQERAWLEATSSIGARSGGNVGNAGNAENAGNAGSAESAGNAGNAGNVGNAGNAGNAEGVFQDSLGRSPRKL